MKLNVEGNKKNIIGPRLREARIFNSLTQKQLSSRLDMVAIYIDRAGISKIEHQQRIVTDFELVTLAGVLNVTPNWLLSGE